MNMGNDRRVIDMNELVKKRIDALGIKMQRPENSGFVDGINADKSGVEELVNGVTLDGDYPEGGFSEGLGALGSIGEGDHIIGTDPAAEAQAIIDEANAEAERIINEAKQKAARMQEEAEALAGHIKEEAKNKGYQAGYTDASNRVSQEYIDKTEALEKEKQELEELYQKKFNEMEPQLVETITDVYEHVLKTDLKMHKSIAGHLVASALRNIEGARSFLIHISKDNYDYVNSRKNILEEAAKVPGSVIEIMEDISLPPDSCMIETDGGIFDCSLGTELSELSTKLRLLSYSKDEN
ncbi:MAG: hypothetical protein ILP17_05610 [Lachnospiraceae bacterium]|nr:hypothetical protein [Lachnospiraceae bacterium]